MHVLAAVAAALTIGCTTSPGPMGACTTNTDCTMPGTECYRGFCVARGDATQPMDLGVRDASVDAHAGAADLGVDANQADAGCDAGHRTCTTGLPGACAMGVQACGGACVPPTPMLERCGGHDADCDGIVDEESSVSCFPTGATGCTQRADGSFACLGLCRTGAQPCAGGTLGACTGAVMPATETCAAASAVALDEDCDGTIDEGCTCTNGSTHACFTGAPMQAGVGVCHEGSQLCAATSWGPCTGSGVPGPESCTMPMVDNDCDGVVGNVPGRGAACPIAGMTGVCASGAMQCQASALACVGPTPVAELCNRLDDDCDGSIDETFTLASDAANCGACGNACGSGTTCCNGVCVDESSDAMHCGACLTSCTGGSCCSAMCIDVANDPMNCGACGHVCSGGRLCCSGQCVDPLRDAANCRTCGTSCSGATSACCGGGCVAPTAPACTGCPVDCSTLTPAQSCCNNTCVDRMTDTQNCGACGHACAAGQVCCGGSCFANDSQHCGGSCLSCVGSLCCSGACVPIDTRHCQACGVSCATGSVCCATGCHDLTSSNTDCGACGAACTGSTPHCSNSHCCGTGLTYCGSACVNLNTDGSNCGSCGHSCLLGCNGSGSCIIL